MRLLELHILQSLPASCVNRDDLNSPKSAVFGGSIRGRVSSQCWKRSIREMCKELWPTLFAGQRTKLIIPRVAEILREANIAEDQIVKLAQLTANAIGKEKEEKKGKKGKKGAVDMMAAVDQPVVAEAPAENENGKLATLVFLTDREIRSVALAIAAAATENPKIEDKDLKKVAATAVKSVRLEDGADVAFHGRMMASNHDLSLEGVASFSQALTTHKAEAELDFFSALDDLQKKAEMGAGMTGIQEFISGTFYRYVSINLSLLDEHLAALSKEDRAKTLRAFVQSVIQAFPSAKKNSFAAQVFPEYVLGTVRTGQQIQLINAFEKPIVSKNGLMDESIKTLKEYYDRTKKTWGINPTVEAVIPDITFDEFLAKLTA